MINIKENENLSILNHSCAHLLAQAVKQLFPQARFWVGPVINDGFYYDIDLGDKNLNDDDIVAIEKQMKKCAKDDKLIIRQEISKIEALDRFKDDPYKIDLISRMDENETVISCYSQGDFTDLCRGPHIKSTKLLKYFKLLKYSGAYWKGDSKNKMLQRIYGVCYENQEDLDKHLQEIEEAKARDHRRIGKERQIFMNHELVGAGMPIWLPNGAIIRKNLENYIYKKEYKLGYKHIYSPCVGTINLYKTSGHYDHYKENMFPEMQVDEETFILRPMNCPHHMLVYKNSLHSYRDLPIRIAEFATDFRYEASGAVKGLERVRCMCQNDAHIFVTPEQIADEFKKVVSLILDVYKDFNITNYKFRLSLRDKENKEKYFDDDKMWDEAEERLRNVLNELNIDYFEAKGEAAFYGPKLDVEVKPAIGPEITLSTCQLDFLLPRKFELSYIDANNQKQVPIVLHRAIFGTFDRFTAFFIEECKGVFPTWLSPNQVNIIPVHHEKHLDYSKQVYSKLLENDIRCQIDESNEKFGFKIRQAQMSKTPYQIVVGDNDIENNTVTVKRYGVQESIVYKLEDFISHIKKEINVY